MARMVMLAAAFAAILWGFQLLLLHHAPSVFNDPKEDMSFGWYVPLFSLYVVWSQRKEILASIGRPSWAGFAATVPFVAIGFLGARGIQVRFEILAFAGLMLTVPWAFFGKETAKKLIFPALFLLFCIPLATFLDIITVHLRILASSTAYAVLKGFGADVVRQGTMIVAADGSFSIDVAEPCSGLRSIFALMALTAAYAYFNQPTWLRRAVLFALSIPIAILGNVFRILTICLVANFASNDFATGFYHDYSGYVVFIVAIALMIAAGEAINKAASAFCRSGGKPGRKPAGEAGASAPVNCALASLPAVATLALLLAAMPYQAATPKTTVAEAPEVALPALEGYDAQELEASEAELTVLPDDTKIVKKLYTAEDGLWFQVACVIGGTSKSSIHRPELCLPSQGFLMTEPRTVKVAGQDWRFITVETPANGKLGFAYSFYNQEGYRTASHVRRIFRDVWDRSVLNRIDRWVMVTVNSNTHSDFLLEQFILKLKGAIDK